MKRLTLVLVSLLFSNLLYAWSSDKATVDICDSRNINKLTEVTCVLYYAPWISIAGLGKKPGYKMSIYEPGIGCSEPFRVSGIYGGDRVSSNEIMEVVDNYKREGYCVNHVFGSKKL